MIELVGGPPTFAILEHLTLAYSRLTAVNKYHLKREVGQVITYRRVNRQYIAMTEDEVWDLIASQRVMFVAFVREDGYPHVTPVWFVPLDHKIYFKGSNYKVKFRLANTGKACCAWETGGAYREMQGAVLWGRSRVVEEPELVATVNRLLADRYAGFSWNPAEVPAAWAETQRTELKTVVEIIPERISSWDNRKLTPESRFG
jgi:nitroimidazol reductase NimA-like FMN-containing flavoprotein (pyridoxamine 5'-phosphate oxidase superfamily)